MQKPNDCTCGFHKTGTHAHWCPSYKRLEARRQRREQERFQDWLMACKDAYGRSVAYGTPYVEPDMPNQ